MVVASDQRQRVPSFEYKRAEILHQYNLNHDKHELLNSQNNVSPAKDFFFIRFRLIIEWNFLSVCKQHCDYNEKVISIKNVIGKSLLGRASTLMEIAGK